MKPVDRGAVILSFPAKLGVPDLRFIDPVDFFPSFSQFLLVFVQFDHLKKKAARSHPFVRMSL